MAKYGEIVAQAFSAMSINPDPVLLGSLKIGGECLSSLTAEFLQLLEIRTFQIVSFYETRTLKMCKSLVSDLERGLFFWTI